MGKMPLKKTLAWTTQKGTRMSADLQYASWRDKIEMTAFPESTVFVESLRLDFYAGETLIGTMYDETLNGNAAIRLFGLEGKIMCNVSDAYEGDDQLIVFDGLDFQALERAWDVLAEAYDPEIYQLRQKYRAQANPRVPEIHFY
jgi:hypothetical protein